MFCMRPTRKHYCIDYLLSQLPTEISFRLIYKIEDGISLWKHLVLELRPSKNEHYLIAPKPDYYYIRKSQSQLPLK